MHVREGFFEMKHAIVKQFAAICGAIALFASAMPTQGAGKPALDTNFINFGYIQSSSILPHVRWNALTDVGVPFTSFDSTGDLTNVVSTFTNRDSSLKAGGAAANAGVNVHMVVLNSGFSSTVTDTVMQSSSKRTALINSIVSAVTTDTYCQGVSFDFEPFSYGSATRDGMVLFFSGLRAALDASSKPATKLSLYTNSTYSSTNYNIPGLEPNIDFFTYSCYDWGTGSSVHAISDANSFIPLVNGFLNAGIPANKMVLTLSSYGKYWTSTASANYGAAGTSGAAIGLCEGLFDTTLNTANSGPYPANYATGDETGWYPYFSTNQHVAVWEDPRAAEYKIRLATCFPGSGGTNNGVRLGGVGWWSLYWFADFATSYNPLPVGTPQGNTSKTRTYPQIYQLCEEILAPAGTTRYVFEKFEQDNPRWASFALTSNASPDNTNWTAASTTKGIAASPAGSGSPPDSTDAMKFHFVYSGSSAGKIFFRHEVLMDDSLNSVADTNAMAARFSQNNVVNAYIDSAAAYTGLTVRLVVMDKNRQLEASPQYSMNSSGWRLVSWDLTDTSVGNVTGLTTSEPAFTSGNGTIDTAGGGANDIGFVGFLVEKAASGSTTGDLYFDELSYEHATPSGKTYTINEFSYRSNSSEFVEIKGPAGAFPTNLQLRIYNSSDGSVNTSVTLGGQTVAGSGLFVVGDTGVANVNLVPSGWGAADNIPSTNPTAVQLVDSVSGCVYDSVVYRAMGGLGDLIRQGTLGVTGEGRGWMGDTGSGTNSAGAVLSYGRYPDGTDTNVNENDFSLQPPTPGAANGTAVSLPASYNFTSTPSTVYQTFASPSIQAMAAGRATSSNGGNVWRCIDTSGGGVQGYIGDVSLGTATDGYTVTGEIYLPPSSDPAQAIGVGICGTKGSNFFSSSPANAGYENGYWLVYESNASAALTDGQSVHSQQFMFEMANNDNQQSTQTLALSSAKTLANVGLGSIGSTGLWTTFQMCIVPSQNRLIARINNSDVYNGTIPSGGPTTGAFQVGFREFTGTTVSNAAEGTWLDNIAIAAPVTASSLTAVNRTTFNFTFSGAVGSSALTASNYTISGVGQGTLAAHPTSVSSLGGNVYQLTWSSGLAVVGANVTVTAGAGVLDSAGFPLNSPNSASVVAAPVSMSGLNLD